MEYWMILLSLTVLIPTAFAAPPTGECFLDISMNGTCTGLMGTASPPENCCSINAVVAYDIMGDELGCMPCTNATVEMNQTELLVIESEGVIQICVSAYISDTPNTNVNVTLNVKEGFQSDIGDIMPNSAVVSFTEAGNPVVMCADFTITNDTDFEGSHTLTVEIEATDPGPPLVTINNPSITTINITDDDPCSVYQNILAHVTGKYCEPLEDSQFLNLTLILKSGLIIPVHLCYRDGDYYKSQRGIRRPAYDRLCCFSGECITRNDVQEIRFVGNEWECHVNSIVTFLQGEKSYAPLSQNLFVKEWNQGDLLNII